MSRHAALSVFALSIGLLLAAPARADVWGYVDAKGVAHFANEKVDERYELFYRGGQGFDTARGVQPDASAQEPRAEFARPVALPANTSKLLTFFDVSPSFKAVRHHLREASSANRIDFELLQAVIATESGFDADAVSPKGAIGLMQLMPATAERYGVAGDHKVPLAKKLTDPRTNIRAGSRYLSDLIAMFSGQLDLALAAYNAGEGAVQRAGNKVPNYKETQNYVKTVMQIYGMLKPTHQADPRRTPSRVRMELPGRAAGSAPTGGAIGRGNMVPSLGAPTSPIAAAQTEPFSRQD